MNEICVWKNGEWCYAHDLPHREELGPPDIQFELPFNLPYEVEQAFINTLMPALVNIL